MSSGMSSVLAKSLAVPRGRRPRTYVAVGQEVDHGAHGPVAAAQDHEPVAVVEDLAHRLGEPRGVPYSVGHAERDVQFLKMVEGLEERPLPRARARVDDQGRGAVVRTAGRPLGTSLVISSSGMVCSYLSSSFWESVYVL